MSCRVGGGKKIRSLFVFFLFYSHNIAKINQSGFIINLADGESIFIIKLLLLVVYECVCVVVTDQNDLLIFIYFYLLVSPPSFYK